MSKIKIYLGPAPFTTAASSGTDADPVDSGVIKVPASGYEEGDWIPLAVKCDSGYKTVEDTSRHARITIEQTSTTNADKWRLAPDDGFGAADTASASAWGALLDFNSEIDDTNTLFHVQGRAHDAEEPINETDIDLKVAATIGAA